jgi:hypothetical protein
MPRPSTLALATLGLALILTAAAAEDAAVRLFNGTDLKGWKLRGPKEKSKWVVGLATLDPKDPSKLSVAPVRPGEVGGPQLVNAAAGVDLYTEQKFADCTVEVEFMVPKGSNSGVYLMGEYEVQILDSYGKKKLAYGDVGGIYNTSAPRVNAAKRPGEWQKFVIDFRAPRFKDGKKVANARFLRVTLNGTLIQEDVEVKGPTTAALTGREAPSGPLLLQGDHGPVAFRNLKIIPRK